MEDILKKKIHTIVGEYKRVMASEYAEFLIGQKAKIKQRANKFGAIKGTQTEMRLLCERPETLEIVLMRQLSADEWKEFLLIPSQRWFAKTFPEFSGAEKI